MKLNFAVLFLVVGCNSGMVDDASVESDETGGAAGSSTAEFGGSVSSKQSTKVITDGSSSWLGTGGSGPNRTTTVGGSSSVGGSSITGGSSTTGGSSSGSSAIVGGSTATGGSSSGSSAIVGGSGSIGGKGGVGGVGGVVTGGKTSSGGKTSTGGRTAVNTGGTSEVFCNPVSPSPTCDIFQVCDATRHCAGPVRNTAIDCSDVSIDGWKAFGYSSATVPDTTFNSQVKCQLAPIASTDPSVQNYCCNFNKNFCMVGWADFPPACPQSGATVGKPYIYDCQRGINQPDGYAMAVANTEYTPAGVGYCYATQTVE